MKDNENLIESLMERAAEYGTQSFELVKLKTLDKTSDIVSSIIPHSVTFVLIASFTIFVNFGLAFWLGDIIGNTFYGFFIVAAFYGIIGIIFHFFIHNLIKRKVSNYIIKQVLK